MSPVPARRPGPHIDPIDWRFDAARPERRGAFRRSRLLSRGALGLSPAPRPGLLLLLVGTALGADALGLLTATVLSYLDPVLSIALAALGVAVGLGLNLRRPREAVLLAASSQEAGITILLVAGGIVFVQSVWPLLGAASWWFALMLGLCASSSSTEASDVPDERSSLAMRIGDLDDLLPLVLGGAALAWIHEAASDPPTVALQTGLIALIIAVAGWLLVAQASSDSEQRVFAVGALLLLGGTAAFLSMSALFTGLVAGAFWNAVGGPIRERVGRDVRALQHPLVVLLLLMAGAQLRVSMEAFALAAVYVACRAIGKLAGGWLAHHVVARDVPSDLGRRLISPGVIAIAFALNALQASPAPATQMLLAVVVIGSLGSELLSLLVSPPRTAS